MDKKKFLFHWKDQTTRKGNQISQMEGISRGENWKVLQTGGKPKTAANQM
jgi:hypothetical protein